MSDLPMMPWWPRDFIAATRAYRLAERGAYRDLLDFQWELGVLPNDTKLLARLLGVSQEEFDEVWPVMRAKFIERDGFLVNERLEKHREKALERRDKQRRGAAKTNAERGKSTTPSDTVSGAVSDTLPGAHPSPSPSPSINMENADDPDYKTLENLNCEAWEMWQAHRRKLKIRKYKTLMKARDLAELPDAMQLECVNFSIGNNYYGLFPDRFKVGNGRKPSYAQQLKADLDAQQ